MISIVFGNCPSIDMVESTPQILSPVDMMIGMVEHYVIRV